MNHLRPIRLRLEMTQKAMAAALGCTQSNVGHYEHGRQSLPPEAARKLLLVAKERGLSIGFDHIYGSAQLPPVAAAEVPKHA
jgi:putative transcriptional regulator